MLGAFPVSHSFTYEAHVDGEVIKNTAQFTFFRFCIRLWSQSIPLHNLPLLRIILSLAQKHSFTTKSALLRFQDILDSFVTNQARFILLLLTFPHKLSPSSSNINRSSFSDINSLPHIELAFDQVEEYLFAAERWQSIVYQQIVFLYPFVTFLILP